MVRLTPLVTQLNKSEPAALDRASHDGQPARNVRDEAVFLALASVLLSAFFVLLAMVLFDQERTPGRQLLAFIIFFAVGPLLVAVCSAYLLHIPTQLRIQRPRRVLVGLWWLAVSVVLAGVLQWCLQGIEQALYSDARVPLSNDRFITGIIVGAAGVLIASVLYAIGLMWLGLRHILLSIVTTVSVAAALLTAAALFDVHVFADTLSYVPYLGPATLVGSGHAPLQDVFSQYGLNYLLFTVAFHWLPYSMASAAALVSLVNVAYYVAFVSVAVKLSKHRVIVALVSIVILLFLSSTYFYNATRTPSVLGMRFLPPLLVTVAICFLRLRPTAHFSVWSVLALALASLWSIEALCISGGVYAAYLVLANRFQRGAWRQVAIQLGLLAACLVTPHVLLSVVYLALGRGLPDYGTYLDLVLNAGTDPSANWTAVVDPAVHTWALFGWGYGLGLTYVVYRTRSAAPSDAGEARVLAVLAGVCILGLGEFAYYVARSSTPLLSFLAWPLALLALVTLDRSIGGHRSALTSRGWTAPRRRCNTADDGCLRRPVPANHGCHLVQFDTPARRAGRSSVADRAARSDLEDDAGYAAVPGSRD
jgi:hypothetical protein